MGKRISVMPTRANIAQSKAIDLTASGHSPYGMYTNIIDYQEVSIKFERNFPLLGSRRKFVLFGQGRIGRRVRLFDAT